MHSTRTQHIERATNSGIDRWLGREGFKLETFAPAELGVVRGMPRRKPFPGIEKANVALPMARAPVFRPTLLQVIGRLFVWLFTALRFSGGNALDRLLGRSSPARRAVRLRRAFERGGASFAKIAQQLSLRADLLPYEYCIELGKLLDRADAFPTAQAIEIIERCTKRPLDQVFSVFDPVPIGSASLACVYQAVLWTGQRVAVKVRRPNVGIYLIADLRALDWMLWCGEALTLIWPGSTRRLRADLEKILGVELNFRNEARYTDIFRERADDKGGITAPRVYFEYCSDEVMVSEFVSGVWMWEIMSAVDANDTDFLAKLRDQGIEPKQLARKLIRSAHRELLEGLFYHADPHPANIVVRADNELCFIDFGSVGRMSQRMRKAWRELHFHMGNGDVERMIQCTLNLVGPLPPVDVDRIVSSLETIYANWVFAMNSSDAEWWERSTAQAMLHFFSVAREHGLPATAETIQFLRATLIYDTIVARLHPNINVADEWAAYAKKAGRQARDRVQKRLRDRLVGPTGGDYLEMELFSDTFRQYLFNWEREVEQPVVHYRSIVGKIAYVATVFLRLASVLLILVGLAACVHYLVDAYFGYSIPWQRLAIALRGVGWLQIGGILVGFLVIRRLLVRLSQPDSKPDVER
jgi:ubiquinone biosynthesis protein